MPCMSRGRVVPGAKGSCPDGSTWSETSGDGEFQMSDVGNYLHKRYVDKEGGFNAGTAAMDALIFVPGLGWVANGARLGAKTAGTLGAKGLGGLINKLFFKPTKAKPAVNSTRINTQQLAPQRAKVIERSYPINNPSPRINPNASPFKPYRASTTRQTAPAIPAGMAPAYGKSSLVLGTGLGLNEQFGMPLTQAGQEAKAQRQVASPASQVPTETPVDPNATAALEAQKESERVAGLGFFDKMKEPGYWDTSITGVEGDDRLSRLGDLLTYYGMPPSGRAAAGKTPSEMWKQRSLDAAAAVASGADSGSDAFSKISGNVGLTGVKNKVEEEYGNTWIPGDVTFGGRLDEKGVEQATAEIYATMVQISKQPGNGNITFNSLYEMAKKIYDGKRQ